MKNSDATRPAGALHSDPAGSFADVFRLFLALRLLRKLEQKETLLPAPHAHRGEQLTSKVEHSCRAAPPAI